MFESKKALNILSELSHQGTATPCVFEESFESCDFSVNNFQICFLSKGNLHEDELIIIEQLLRFEEVLPFKDWQMLSFREFESFLRDKNSSPSVFGVNIKSTSTFFSEWKKKLKNIVRVKKGLDVLKQSSGDLSEFNFIEACDRLDSAFKKLHLEGIFEDDHFYKIYHYSNVESTLTFQIETSYAVDKFEIELLKLLAESIVGIKQVKMVARES